MGRVRMNILEVKCLCGATKLHLSGEPGQQFYCHCDGCQAVAGGAYVKYAMYPANAMKVVQGEPIRWKFKNTPRARCATCGVVLYADIPELGVVGVNGYLLPNGAFKPEFHANCGQAVLPIQDDLPHFKEYPPKFGGSDEKVDW
jgi:hypothetical protein